jgi:hypothetical protein
LDSKVDGAQENKELSMEEPSINDLNPVLKPGVPREPIAIIDTSGSMDWPAAQDSPVKRREVIGEAMGMLVAALAAQDSQAAQEKAAGEEKGGLLTFTFAAEATELGDLSPENWRQKWDSIRWGGGTQIMPAWELAEQAYLEEFGETPALDRPALLTLVITDGEAKDAADFGKVLEQAKVGRYFCVAVVGFGPDHDQTLNTYRQVAASNPHVRLVTFGGETNPQTIADGLISLVG